MKKLKAVSFSFAISDFKVTGFQCTSIIYATEYPGMETSVVKVYPADKDLENRANKILDDIVKLIKVDNGCQ